MAEIPDLDNAGLRKFAITTGGVITLLFGLAFPWLFDRGFPIWPWIVFAVLTVWGITAPATLRPVYTGWMRFALILSKITTPIILGIVFVIVFLPVSLIFRILGKDPMHRKTDDSIDSYKVQSTKPKEGNLERPF